MYQPDSPKKESKMSESESWLKKFLDQKFDAVDAKFDAIDQKFDAQFKAINQRFDAQNEFIEEKFKSHSWQLRAITLLVAFEALSLIISSVWI